MANQRGTFAKRNREMKLKDRAKEKVERRNNRTISPTDQKGPQIAWDQAGGTELAEIAASTPAPVVDADPQTPTDTDS